MLRRQQDRMRAMLGGKVDAALLDTPEARREVLDGMISQRLLAEYAVKSNLTVSDDRVREVIVSIPAFQDGGKFSSARYEAALRQELVEPNAHVRSDEDFVPGSPLARGADDSSSSDYGRRPSSR